MAIYKFKNELLCFARNDYYLAIVKAFHFKFKNKNYKQIDLKFCTKQRQKKFNKEYNLNARAKIDIKILFVFLVLLFLILFSMYIYKNTHNGITASKEQTKVLLFKGIAYDIYQLRPFDTMMTCVKKNIKYEIGVRNGKLNDRILRYYSNGNLKSVEIGKEGNGCSLFYYENGNLEAKYCFENGQLSGNQALFYKNGNVKMQAYFQNDEPTKDYFIYRENGILWYKIIISEKEKVEEFDEYGKSLGYINKEHEQRLKKELEAMLLNK